MTYSAIKTDVSIVKTRLNQQIEDVVRVLLPNGKRNGKYYKVGSVNGEEGDSMAVIMEGDKTGQFSDYNGASGDYGDLIDLWMLSKGMPDFNDAIADIKGYLGITEGFELNKAKNIDISKKSDYSKPLTEPMLKYLTETRKLSIETINNYKLCSIGGKIAFPYYQGQKVKMHKTLKVKKGENEWMMNSGDKEISLFGWQSIKNTDREVVITEGEIDAMSFHEQGIPALSVPNGAGSGKIDAFMESDHPHLMNHFKTFYISMDMDESGETMVPGLIKSLGSTNCRIVKLPEIPGEKSDGNECHKAGKDLKYYITTSQYPPVPGIINCSEAFEDAMKIFRDDITVTGKPLPWGKYEKHFRFRPAEVTIWAGYNSSGKSMLINFIMVTLGMMNEKCLIASLEMKKGKIMHRLMRQANSGKNPSDEYAGIVRDYLAKSIWMVNKQGSIKPDELMKKLGYAVARYGVTHLVIDPLAKCGMREDDYSAQKLFVEDMTDFAHEHDVHVHIVMHTRKGESESSRPDKMDIKGSGGMTDMTDNAFIMFKNVKKKELLDMINNDGYDISSLEDEKKKKAEKILSQPDFYLGCVKQRNGEWEGTIKLWFHENTLQFVNEANGLPINFVNYSKLESDDQRR